MRKLFVKINETDKSYNLHKLISEGTETWFPEVIKHSTFHSSVRSYPEKRLQQVGGEDRM